MTWQANLGIILGVLGFVISLFNAGATIRQRTIGNQAQLLSQLRPLLDDPRQYLIELRRSLNFDRLDVDQHRAQIPDPPRVLLDSLKEIPALSGQLLSPSSARIEHIRDLMNSTYGHWDELNSKLSQSNLSSDIWLSKPL